MFPPTKWKLSPWAQNQASPCPAACTPEVLKEKFLVLLLRFLSNRQRLYALCVKGSWEKIRKASSHQRVTHRERQSGHQTVQKFWPNSDRLSASIKWMGAGPLNKKQRHYFANKGPSSQSYGFSSSHVCMWELDYKESWVLKNWCFWTVVLEKTLESPLDSKEIQPVHAKGNQSWIVIGRTDAEAETPIFWPPDVKNQLTWKDLDAGNDWRWEEKGMTEDEMVGWHHQLNGHEFE